MSTMTATSNDLAAIIAEDLHKSFSSHRRTVTAVDGLSFRVGRGEIFGLLGPNGAGKPNIGYRHFFPDPGARVSPSGSGTHPRSAHSHAGSRAVYRLAPPGSDAQEQRYRGRPGDARRGGFRRTCPHSGILRLLVD